MVILDKVQFDSSYYGGRVITAIYNGALAIWSAIKSCFGAGYWRNEAPWSNVDGWKNN